MQAFGRGGRFALFFVLNLIIVKVTVFTPRLSPCSPLGTIVARSLRRPDSTRPFKASGLKQSLLSHIVFKAEASLVVALYLITIVFIVNAFLKIVTKCFNNIISTIVVHVTSVVVSFPKLMLTVTVTNVLKPGLIGTIVSVTTMD